MPITFDPALYRFVYHGSVARLAAKMQSAGEKLPQHPGIAPRESKMRFLLANAKRTIAHNPGNALNILTFLGNGLLTFPDGSLIKGAGLPIFFDLVDPALAQNAAALPLIRKLAAEAQKGPFKTERRGIRALMKTSLAAVETDGEQAVVAAREAALYALKDPALQKEAGERCVEVLHRFSRQSLLRGIDATLQTLRLFPPRSRVSEKGIDLLLGLAKRLVTSPSKLRRGQWLKATKSVRFAALSAVDPDRVRRTREAWRRHLKGLFIIDPAAAIEEAELVETALTQRPDMQQAAEAFLNALPQSKRPRPDRRHNGARSTLALSA